MIQRQDLGGRQAPLVDPHIRDGADEGVEAIRRVARDVDVWTSACGEGAAGKRRGGYLDAIEVGAHRGPVIDTDVVVPGPLNELLRPGCPALGSAVADIKETRRAATVEHELEALGVDIGVGIGDEPRVGVAEVGGVEPDRDRQGRRGHRQRGVYILLTVEVGAHDPEGQRTVYHRARVAVARGVRDGGA